MKSEKVKEKAVKKSAAPTLNADQKRKLFMSVKTYKDFSELKGAWRRRCFVVMDDIKLVKEIISKEQVPCVLRKAKKHLARLLKRQEKAESKTAKSVKKEPEAKSVKAPAPVKTKKERKIEKLAAAQSEALSKMPDSPKPAPKKKAAVKKPKASKPAKAKSVEAVAETAEEKNETMNATVPEAPAAPVADEVPEITE